MCFDLSRSIDLHMRSADQTGERAVAGVTSGLIGANETVTWQAKHFGINFSLTSIISAFDPPNHFRDSMTSGPFARIDHDHYFESLDANKTIMRDVFDFNSPLGPLGALVDSLILTSYMRNFLVKRNAEIKHVAETNPSQYLP